MKTYKESLKEVSLSFLDSKLKNLTTIGVSGYKLIKASVAFIVGVVFAPIDLPISALLVMRKASK